MASLMRLLREPLLHFLVIGGLIFGLYAATHENQARSAGEIVITPQRIAQLAAGYRSVWKRMPTKEELDGLIEQDIREEVYYREALALGLDRNDPPVRRRMRQKMEFLMDNSAQLMVPGEGELKAFFAAHSRDYQRPPRVAFEQVYLGERPAATTVAKILATLRSDPAVDPRSLGERTLLPAALSLSVSNAVNGVFGSGFFERLATFAPGVWSGPVASSYGVHLVRVRERVPARTPPLDEIRDAVLRDWRSARAQEIRDRDYAERRKRYVIKVQRNDAAQAEIR